MPFTERVTYYAKQYASDTRYPLPSHLRALPANSLRHLRGTDGPHQRKEGVLEGELGWVEGGFSLSYSL